MIGKIMEKDLERRKRKRQKREEGAGALQNNRKSLIVSKVVQNRKQLNLKSIRCRTHPNTRVISLFPVHRELHFLTTSPLINQRLDDDQPTQFFISALKWVLFVLTC